MPKKKKYSFFKKCIDKRKIICYNNQASRGNILVYAAMAQLVEHILGKDEVPSSNLGSSSRQPRREIFGALAFSRGFQAFFKGVPFYFGVVRSRHPTPYRRWTRHPFGTSFVQKSPPDSSQFESKSNVKQHRREIFGALAFYRGFRHSLRECLFIGGAVLFTGAAFFVL